MLTRETGKVKLSPLADHCLIPALQNAIDRYLGMPPDILRPLTKSTRSGIINNLAVDEARQLIETDILDDVKIDDTSGQAVFLIEDIAVRLKKVDAGGRHRNVRTKRQRRWDDQSELFLDRKLNLVMFGYEIDEFWRSITNAGFSCWQNSHRLWAFESVGDLQGFLPAIAAEETQVRRSRVRPKGIDGKEGIGG